MGTINAGGDGDGDGDDENSADTVNKFPSDYFLRRNILHLTPDVIVYYRVFILRKVVPAMSINTYGRQSKSLPVFIYNQGQQKCTTRCKVLIRKSIR